MRTDPQRPTQTSTRAPAPPARRAAALLLWLFAALALAEPAPPAISIILDDLGNDRVAGERCAALPGPVACSILPGTPYARRIAEAVNAAGKEVMLHLPMQAVRNNAGLGPRAISLDTSHGELRAVLAASLAEVPHVRGLNPHMGSLLTRHPGHMQWLMGALAERGELFFVDSFTTPESVALQLAAEAGVPAMRRHVFLDNHADAEFIAAQFDKLVSRARRTGHALAIGHGRPATLAFLESRLDELDGVQLVPVAELIALRGGARRATAPSGGGLSGIAALAPPAE